MPDTLDVVTFAQVSAMLNVPDAEAALIDRYITVVSRHIDDLCGPVVQRTVTAETHHGGTCSIVLDKRPVISVTSVTENGTTVSAAGYHIDLEAGILERVSSSYYSYPWYAGRWNVAVTYEAGRYEDTASVDPIFVEAATMAVKGLWTSQKAIGGTVSFGAYGSDLADNVDVLGGQQFVFPKAAYMLLRGGNYIKAKLGIA